MTTTPSVPDYPAFLAAVTDRILRARISAARAVNNELILLYWDIGRGIVEKQHLLGWGESVIDRLSLDLRAAFPQATGFSPRNLRDMKRFYLAYADPASWREAGRVRPLPGVLFADVQIQAGRPAQRASARDGRTHRGDSARGDHDGERPRPC